MFKLGQSDKFSYPVSVEITVDGGKRQAFSFDAIFKRLNREEFTQAMTQAAAGELDDLTLASDVLVGWKGIQDEDGADLPYSEAARDKVLNVWPVLPAVIKAFVESHSKAGRVKN
jgi:hypothetical protein